jgi:hypothetical protein
MAHGYAKVTGKPMGLLFHGTVGVQHAAMALYNAWCDRVPMLLMCGNDVDGADRLPGVPTTHSALDPLAMVRDFTKWDDQPGSLQHCAESLVRAYKISMTAPMEPVGIVLDSHLQEHAIEKDRRPTIPKLSPVAPPVGDRWGPGSRIPAIVISPFYAPMFERGVGFELIDPEAVIEKGPFSSAQVFINTDWAAKNPQVVKDYYVAYMRGVREYCQAYHGGPNRAEVVELAQKTGIEKRQEVLEKLPWPSRSPYGRASIANILDVQDWFHAQGSIQQKFPAEKLVDTTYADHANAKLGKYEVANSASTLKGCR